MKIKYRNVSRQNLSRSPPFDKVNSLGRERPRSRTFSQKPESRSFGQHMDTVAQNVAWDDTHACLTMGGTVVCNVIPRKRRALAQYTPVLSGLIVDPHNPSFDATGPRSVVSAALEIDVRELR